MADYTLIVAEMRSRYHVRVRRWRRNMTGCAWRVCYQDGRSINWIEAPHPRTPISLSIFLHEVGHHAIGFERFPLQCEEEFHAWQFALTEMRRAGVEPDARVERRFELSMRYAVAKAVRRGLKEVPAILRPYAPDDFPASVPAAA